MYTQTKILSVLFISIRITSLINHKIPSDLCQVNPTFPEQSYYLFKVDWKQWYLKSYHCHKLLIDNFKLLESLYITKQSPTFNPSHPPPPNPCSSPLAYAIKHTEWENKLQQHWICKSCRKSLPCLKQIWREVFIMLKRVSSEYKSLLYSAPMHSLAISDVYTNIQSRIQVKMLTQGLIWSLIDRIKTPLH